MDYEVIEGNGEAGSLQVFNGDIQEVVAEEPLESTESEAVIHTDLNGQNVVLRVIVNEGASVRIKRFTYDK